jgi:hypothetical protein
MRDDGETAGRCWQLVRYVTSAQRLFAFELATWRVRESFLMALKLPRVRKAVGDGDETRLSAQAPADHGHLLTTNPIHKKLKYSSIATLPEVVVMQQ